MKRKGILIAAIIPLLLVGCIGSENWKEYKASKDEVIPIYAEKEFDKMGDEETSKTKFKNVEYNLQELELSFAKSPYSILCEDEFILVSDIKKNCIFKFGYDGKLIDTIGKLGNGDEEFSYPTDIEKFNDKYYILDSRNNRVKIYDKELKFIENIKLGLEDKLEFTPEKMIFENLCVTDKGIFVNGFNVLINNLSFYDFNTKEFKTYDIPFYGSMSYYKGKVYGINNYAKVYNKVNDTFNGMTGLSTLYEIPTDKTEIKKLNQVEGVGNDADFYILNDEIVSLDLSSGSIVKNKMSGKYIDSMGNGIKALLEERGSISHDKEGKNYCLNRKDNKVYILSQK